MEDPTKETLLAMTTVAAQGKTLAVLTKRAEIRKDFDLLTENARQWMSITTTKFRQDVSLESACRIRQIWNNFAQCSRDEFDVVQLLQNYLNYIETLSNNIEMQGQTVVTAGSEKDSKQSLPEAQELTLPSTSEELGDLENQKLTWYVGQLKPRQAWALILILAALVVIAFNWGAWWGSEGLVPWFPLNTP